MLNILLMIILIIILFIFILLYIGLRISLKYEKKGPKLEGCLKLLILKKIKIYSHEYPSLNETEEDEEEETERTDPKRLLELARPCIGDLKEFLNSFLKSMKVTRLENHLVFGLDDYADTGKYIGIIWAVLAVANNVHKKARLTAEPSFNGSVLDSRGDFDIEINIIKLIIPSARLISKKEIRNLIRGVRNG